MQAPPPLTVSAAGGQSISVGSFNYANLTEQVQVIGSLVVSVSDPSTLSELSATASPGGERATTSAIASSTVLTFSPPVTISPGVSVTFALTATLSSGAAMNAEPIAYAGILTRGGVSPIGQPLAEMLFVGLLLMPLGIGQRRRAVLIALGVLALMATAAGCGNSGSAAPSQQTVIVDSQGNLSKPLILRTIKNSGESSSQQVTAVRYQ
jgi:hypothetical protein